jgi:hypothetical protein
MNGAEDLNCQKIYACGANFGMDKYYFTNQCINCLYHAIDYMYSIITILYNEEFKDWYFSLFSLIFDEPFYPFFQFY